MILAGTRTSICPLSSFVFCKAGDLAYRSEVFVAGCFGLLSGSFCTQMLATSCGNFQVQYAHHHSMAPASVLLTCRVHFLYVDGVSYVRPMRVRVGVLRHL